MNIWTLLLAFQIPLFFPTLVSETFKSCNYLQRVFFNFSLSIVPELERLGLQCRKCYLQCDTARGNTRRKVHQIRPDERHEHLCSALLRESPLRCRFYGETELLSSRLFEQKPLRGHPYRLAKTLSTIILRNEDLLSCSLENCLKSRCHELFRARYCW